MAGLFQQFQNALQQQQQQQSAQAGGKKRRPVRKPVRAAAKPKRLVNKRALHNRLMKQLGGFFDDIAEFTNGSSDDKTMKEKAKYTNHPSNTMKENLTMVNDMVNAVPTSLVPLAGGARRYKKVAPKKSAPKKRPVVRKYRFSGGYEEDGGVEEFEESGASGTATSMIPVSTGGRMHRRSPVRRTPVRRARSPSSSTRRPRPRVRRV